MELKDYQKLILKEIKVYLESLAEQKTKYDRFREMDPDYDSDFSKKAWESVSTNDFTPKQNGIDEYLPNFCIKVPTGGGKTLLATHSIDLIQNYYTNQKTGFVLWIVPTNQIYRQTLSALRNREHPYRQTLDLSSGGRTVILERTDRFSPQDVEENLCVMVLMLPAANRQNKETLKMFQDSSGFESFFPPEDQPTLHDALIQQMPNLDVFVGENGFFGKQIKTSLGNTLRVLQPIVIIDEGQRAYSQRAQETIRGFNPRIVVELSATPPAGSNILVSVSGQDLNKEEMIKLDLHVINKASTEWKHTLLSTVDMRNQLEQKAEEYESQTGRYIRPITLIQVERTGKNQRGQGYIHSEDAKEYLIRECNISPEEIAIKSSDKDDIEGIDLMNRDCSIRYIITKQALQEGWDCPFAYVLAVLTNSSAVTAMTQLVGRVLRQPYANKTGIQLLDESYVYCFQQSSQRILEGIRNGLTNEGMGDLAGRVVESQERPESKKIEVKYREKFKHFEGKIYLPRFAIQEEGKWRELSYEMDLVSRIDWSQIDLEPVKNLTLSSSLRKEERTKVNLSEEEKNVLKRTGYEEKTSGLSIDYVFMTRHLISIVPNPWIAYEMSEQVITAFRDKGIDDNLIASNLVFIVEELEKRVQIEKDRLAEGIFKQLIKDKVMHFFIEETTGYKLPKRIKASETNRRLTRDTGEPIQLSLFEYFPEDDFNEMEKKVAIYLDKQEKLLWWYRNMARADYFVQGWKKNKIFPDFIVAEKAEDYDEDYSKVYVVETKGLHLKNEDTKYKENVFALCNDLGKEMSWDELGLEFESDKPIEFQVVYENEWERRFNEMFEKIE
ncbi:type III restriction enzyme [Evansella vedderi]|uniref:Type III restriction enzyme n=1 Tax=Evansella vedderi TaxID=38282 RepID=A0ABT9ZWN8_9BACI|nr:DEAD/DEAH box helicase family protein [Evansella vedderi]MDQ0255645.1 type III restriction enzyme [Evansella vedderi]